MFVIVARRTEETAIPYTPVSRESVRVIVVEIPGSTGDLLCAQSETRASIQKGQGL